MTDAIVVRYTTKPEAADENARLVAAVFAALERDRPDGLRYACLRLADGVSFVHVAAREPGDDVLSRVPEFVEFQREIGSRVIAPPEAQQASFVGSYRLLG